MRLPILAATTAALTLGVLSAPADAAQRKVAIPNKFDGNWSIEVITQDGPCDRAYRYGIQVYRGEAIYPGGDVSIRGRVSKTGAVSGIISRGADSAQVSGRLTVNGSGGGNWGSTGDGPIGCSGRWTATRRG